MTYFSRYQRFWLEETLDWLTINGPILFIDQIASIFDFCPTTLIINPDEHFSLFLIVFGTHQVSRSLRDKATWTWTAAHISDTAE
jgi:hypothetical protein